jgi:TolA-binding protein
MQQDVSVYHVIRGTIILIVAVTFIGWLFIRALKRSEDPARLVFKWVLTAGVICIMLWKVFPFVEAGGYAGAFIGVPLVAGCGVALAAIWRYNIASMVAKPFGALYDGGTEEIEPRPYYSIAEAQRKRGRYTEAIAHIRGQLDKFPTDLQGQMLLAEIQTENLNDLQGAEITINRLCEQEVHSPQSIAFALNTLADWNLKYAQDREAARQALERIVLKYPNSELALLASQRIGHLASIERLLEPYDRQRMPVPEGDPNLGLLQSSAHYVPKETDPDKLADEYVAHLQKNPYDTEARENLAVLYADHFDRLDLAEDQLNQLIEQPNQPSKRVVGWLNRLADLQIRHGAGYDAARRSLERIAERYPDHAAADLARNRINLLKLELKGKEKSQAVKLGSYEHNIGLKQGLPRQL